MLKEFNWKEKEDYHSQQVGEYEVAVERMIDFHRVSLWRGQSKEFVESQDFVGTDLNSLVRALVLGDQLLKQNTKKVRKRK